MKKDSEGNITFTAKGGAWFSIVVCAITLGIVGWVIVDGITGSMEANGWDVLFYALMLFLFIYVGYLLVYNINMLKAKITIGPKRLVLDGAIDRTRRHRNPFHRNYIKSDLVVECVRKTAIMQGKL